MWLDVCRSRPRFASIRPTGPNNGTIWPKGAETGRTSAQIGQCLPRFGRSSAPGACVAQLLTDHFVGDAFRDVWQATVQPSEHMMISARNSLSQAAGTTIGPSIYVPAQRIASLVAEGSIFNMHSFMHMFINVCTHAFEYARACGHSCARRHACARIDAHTPACKFKHVHTQAKCANARIFVSCCSSGSARRRVSRASNQA